MPGLPKGAVEAEKLHGTAWPEEVWLTMREHPHAPTDFYLGKGNLPCRRYGPIPAIREQERERIEAERCESCDDTGIYEEGSEWAACGECAVGRGFFECLQSHAAEVRKQERERYREGVYQELTAENYMPDHFLIDHLGNVDAALEDSDA